MVSGFGRYQPQGSSYRACRGPRWNRWRVCHRLTCWNGRLTKIIGKISVNDSIQFLEFSDQAWGSGLPFIAKLLSRVESTGRVSSNNSNHNWWVRFNTSNIITNVAWGASVNAHTDYLPWSPVNPCAAWQRACNDFFCRRPQERLWRQYNQRNPLVSSWVHRQGKNKDVPVTQ